MKNLKKLLAVIITVALMATMMVPVFAADEISADAEICANLNLLLGEDDGVTSEYLAKNTERIQTAIVFLRLLGKEAEAVSFDGEENFADADKVAWKAGRNVLAYLKANDDLGWVGNPDGTFDPNSKVTPQMIYKVILEVLGYKAGDGEDFDFSWKETLDFAADKGLDKVADLKNLTNDDLAAAIVEALKAETVDGEVLVEKLVEDGIIDKDDAIAEGLIEDELKVEVKATAANIIEIAANKAFDASTAKFEVKLGYVPQDVKVTYSEDKKTAILTSEANFVAGDYTVIAEGIETALKIEAQKMVSFTISTVALTAESSVQPVKYAAVDQYGNVFDYAASNFTASAMNISDGTAITISANGNEFSIAALGSALKDKKVLVTITHNSNGLSQSMTYTVGAVKAVDSIEFGTPAPKADTNRIEISDTSDKLILPITFKDQYGTVITPASGLWTGANSEVMFISSNTNIVDPANFGVDADNKVTYQTGAVAGKVTITAIARNSGKTNSVTFEVFAPAALASVQLQQPAGLVVADEAVTVNYVGKDSYGADKKLSAVSNLVWFSTNPTVVDVTNDLAVDSKGVLTVTPSAAGVATISAFLGGVKQGEITLDVKAAAVATKITKLADGTITYFSSKSGTKTYSNADFVIVDQYNRAIATADLGGAITVAVKDASTNVVTASGAAITAVAAGTKTIVATYTDGAIVLTREFTATVIDDNSVVNYKVSDIANKLLRSNSWADAAAAGDYARQFVVEYGLDSSGNKVALSAVDAADVILTTTSSEVTIDSATRKVFAAGTSNDKTAIVAAWKKGVKIAEVTFTTSNAAPAIASFAFDKDSYTVAKGATIATALKDKVDQYGVAYTPALTVYYFSNSAAIATVATDGKVTGVASGEVTITCVTSSGLYATTKVVVE